MKSIITSGTRTHATEEFNIIPYLCPSHGSTFDKVTKDPLILRP
jgi:hypothetical protein